MAGEVRLVKSRGRFVEEENFQLFINGELVAVGKLFRGRRPHWSPWAEFYLLKSRGDVAREAVVHIANELGRRGHMMIYYSNHPDIFKAIEEGVPIEDTWLGELMASVGCRPSKIWYFPEGGLEGDVKVQCEFQGQH